MTTEAPATPALPDYYTDYGAVLKDANVKWRNGRAPDYKRMHADYEAGKTVNHEPGTFSFLVNNLVKKCVSLFFSYISKENSRIRFRYAAGKLKRPTNLMHLSGALLTPPSISSSQTMDRG
jgi:hypothetical protein